MLYDILKIFKLALDNIPDGGILFLYQNKRCLLDNKVFVRFQMDIMEREMNEKCCCKTRTKVRSDEEKRALEIRLNKIIGQLNGIKNMVAEDRYCDDILVQLSAVDKSVKSLSNLILDAHMHTCLVENIQAGNIGVVDEIVDLFKRFQ